MKLITLVLSIWLITSCGNQHFLQSSYTGDVTQLIKTSKYYQYTIQSDDKLTLSIWNHDDLSIGSLFSIYNSNESYGKWVVVDSSGYVNLPQLGAVYAKGKSCQQFSDSLSLLFGKYLINPVIVVKVINREVTMLGEVKSPGNYLIEKETNSLYELIGKGEGLTSYANVKRIQLIRNDTSYVLNLAQLGPNYSINIQADDIVYIPAKRGKIIDQKAPTIIPFASAFTAIAVLFSVFNK